MKLLKEAKKKFKKGELFISATGNIKVPIMVNDLKEGENYLNSIFNESGGVIVYEDEDTGELIWATKL